MPGLALGNHQPAWDDEIGLEKGELFLVLKRHKFWCYIIKKSSGKRGWAPGWLVGKVERTEENVSPAASALLVTEVIDIGA